MKSITKSNTKNWICSNIVKIIKKKMNITKDLNKTRKNNKVPATRNPQFPSKSKKKYKKSQWAKNNNNIAIT
jgi:hypothetical protein